MRGTATMQSNSRAGFAQFRCVRRFAAEPAFRREMRPLGVDLPDLLHHLEQARSFGNAAGFQRW